MMQRGNTDAGRMRSGVPPLCFPIPHPSRLRRQRAVAIPLVFGRGLAGPATQKAAGAMGEFYCPLSAGSLSGGKFDIYGERVIPTFHQRAAKGLGRELTAVTLAGAWYSKSELETEASNIGVDTVFTLTNSRRRTKACPKRAALTNRDLTFNQGPGMSHGGGLEPTALTLAEVMRSLVSMPAVTTATQIQDSVLESQCFDDGTNSSRTGVHSCDRRSQINSNCTSTSTDEESAAPVSGTVDLGTA
eukprot:3423834-Rhodomonas_salina.1